MVKIKAILFALVMGCTPVVTNNKYELVKSQVKYEIYRQNNSEKFFEMIPFMKDENKRDSLYSFQNTWVIKSYPEEKKNRNLKNLIKDMYNYYYINTWPPKNNTKKDSILNQLYKELKDF